MAPRELQLNVSKNDHYDSKTNNEKNFDTPKGGTSTNLQQEYHKQQQQQQKRKIFFRIGPLRFGVHGIAGILSLIFVLYALYLASSSSSSSKQEKNAIPTHISAAIVITTLTSAIGSYSLLPQVPNSSQITTPSSWMSSNIITIVPPHREAFKRTIAIIGYLNLRLVHEWKWTKWTFTLLQQTLPQFFSQYEQDQDQQGLVLNENWLFALALFLYTNYHFFPIRLDYKNGNTFVFVLPMFIGFNIDATRQFPTLVYDNEYSSSSSILNVNVNWDDVYRWNEKVIDETYLLLTLLCTLQIAFMFTVALRGRMSIKTCYWISALEVALLFIRLFN